jgi:hypothetical protein
MNAPDVLSVSSSDLALRPPFIPSKKRHRSMEQRRWLVGMQTRLRGLEILARVGVSLILNMKAPKIAESALRAQLRRKKEELPNENADCISAAPAALDRYLRGFTGHVAHPGRSIRQGLWRDAQQIKSSVPFELNAKNPSLRSDGFRGAGDSR